MTFAPTDLLTVYLESRERLKVGRLARNQRRILFEYDSSFIPSGIEISPLKLPLKGGVFTPSETMFEGLFGVFSVLAYNRDDHAKNFSFLLDESHVWRFAPAYDLTFSHGPGGEQASMVMGEGRSPGIPHLRALGKEHSLKKAAAILEKVQSAVSHWKDYAEQAGVTSRSTKDIGRKIKI